MNFIKKIGHNLTALAIVPLVSIENEERERRIKGKLQRSEKRKLNKNGLYN